MKSNNRTWSKKLPQINHFLNECFNDGEQMQRGFIMFGTGFKNMSKKFYLNKHWLDEFEFKPVYTERLQDAGTKPSKELICNL